MTDPTDPNATCPTCRHPWSQHRPRPLMAWLNWWRCEQPTFVNGGVTVCNCPNVPPAAERAKQGRK
jgi:hypothetical protein